ncbi:hypothetical protein SAMN04488134_11017 [Amphibacillus marinus]|uniref:Carbohydrate-binding protein n=1 Tax=Amphibacillus marinus TaxID=872970 RepID=A0A1H8RAM7_9BACI|nr:hypothetical protein [Amphibacillus marinus]SEO63432.1 hypothetical protein SAMN04488134_11017 [Amphibacillus marinus]
MITIQVIDKNNQILKTKTAAQRVFLDYLAPYQEGDKVQIELNQSNRYLVAQLDEALLPSLIYVPNKTWTYSIPIDEKAREAYSSKVFAGTRHYLTIREATVDEQANYQNLALNAHDQKQESGAYPHATANVETRNDSTFFARNAIDGVFANEDHGPYPYQSWGINQQQDAKIRIDFGRLVKLNKLALTLRADFPHDSYWTQVTVIFSDGSQEKISLAKSKDPQFHSIEEVKHVSWLELQQLIKADDPSPFPALTQLEAYGYNLDS